MRVLRVVLGILTLLFAMPVLAAGALGWWTMQHRSPDGAFHADLAPISAQTGVVVFPDVDAILRRDAPFARADQTELRLTADRNAFIGMARPADLAGYLAGASYTEISGISLGRGPLATKTRPITGAGEPLAPPAAQDLWVRSGIGELVWTPTTDRDRHLALIVITAPATNSASGPTTNQAPDSTANSANDLAGASSLDPTTTPAYDPSAVPSLDPSVNPAASTAPGEPTANASPAIVDLSVALTAGWLTSTTWGLLILGPILLLLGLAALAWPHRPREIVYVVDTPTATHAGLPLPAPRSSTPALPAAPPPPSTPALHALSAPPTSFDSDPPAASSFSYGATAPSARSAADASSSAASSSGSRVATGIPFAGGLPSASAYAATLPTQPTFQPSLAWPPADSPATTKPSREITTQELPLVDPENPMPTAGVQLHLAKPQ